MPAVERLRFGADIWKFIRFLFLIPLTEPMHAGSARTALTVRPTTQPASQGWLFDV
jgi:hypothetical protein